MPNLAGLLLTDKGRSLLAKVQIGGLELKFTRVAVGDGKVVDGQNFEAFETLINHRVYAAIIALNAPGDGSSQISIHLDNQSLTQGFFLREYGLMANDPDEGEILYSYTNAGDECDFLIAGGGPRVVEIETDFITITENATNITAAIPSGTWARKVDITAHDEDPDAHAGRINKMDAALGLYKLYSPNYVEFELWVSGWTMLYMMDNKVSSATAGTDRVKLDKIENVIKDKEYVIADAEKSETIIVADILDANTIWTRAALQNTFGIAKIRRTNWTITESGQAEAGDGAEYYASDLLLQNKDCDKSLIIRRQDNDAVLSVAFQDSTHLTWTEVPWVWERPQISGMTDMEYAIPARGLFQVRIICTLGASAVVLVIDHIVFCACATGLGGNHRPPVRPTILSPTTGATDVGEQPTITTSAYSHPVSTALLGVRVQIGTTVNFASGDVVFDSGTVPGISVAPPKGVLAESTLYYARALHEDVKNGQTEWTPVVSFTTASSFVTMNPPVCIAPAANSTIGSPVSLTLVSSAFSISGSADTQSAAQWQLASDAALSDILVDSGEDTVNLTSYNIPDGTVERGSTYYWRVKHKAETEGWGDWSTTTVFTVAALSVESVSSGRKYTGGSTPHSIDAGMDLLGQTGMLMLKSLSTAAEHSLVDTVRGIGTAYAKVLEPHSNSAEQETTAQGGVSSFDDNGFTLGLEDRRYNYPGDEYIARIVMKDPRLLDIIAWTGDGNSGRGESYDLDISVGLVVVFRLDADADTLIWHKDLPAGKNLVLNSTGGQVDGSAGIISAAGGTLTLGDDARVNALDGSYIAYVFGHDTAADGVIQAGVYQGSTVPISNTYTGNTSLSNLPENTELILSGKGGARTSSVSYTYGLPGRYSQSTVLTAHNVLSGGFTYPLATYPPPALNSLAESITINYGIGYLSIIGSTVPNDWLTLDELTKLGFTYRTVNDEYYYHDQVTLPLRDFYISGAQAIGKIYSPNGTHFANAYYNLTSIPHTTYYDGQSAYITVNGTTKYFQGQNAAGTSWPTTNASVNTGSATSATLTIPSGGNINVSYSVPGLTEVDLGWGLQFLFVVNITSGGDRIILDSARGLTDTSSSRLALNTPAAEDNTSLMVVPQASGFKPNAYELNKSGEQYVYFAIRKPEED